MEGAVLDWDKIEAAGHDFTLLNGPVAGRSIYCCENCMTLMVLCNSKQGIVAVWQSPHGNDLCTPRRIKEATIKSKLAHLDSLIWAKLQEL